MKKAIYIMAGIFCTSLITACGNDWLDLEPSTAIPTEDANKTLSEIEFSLNGIYHDMANSDAYSGRLMYYGDVTGDDMQAVSSTCRTGNYYSINWTANTGPTSHWRNLFSIIQSCNLILGKIDNIEVLDEDANEKIYRDDLKGQALAIRGLALFDLTKLYGYTYLRNNGTSLGVPIITEVSNEINSAKPSRSTVAQCYESFIKDLKDGATLLYNKYSWSKKNLNSQQRTINRKGKMSKWAALTILSRAYLYMGENTKALEAAEEAIEGAEKDGYKLWSNAEYATAWSLDASAQAPGEQLFEIVNLTTDSPGNESMGYLNSADGYEDMCITASFYQHMMKTPNDVRIKLFSADGDEIIYLNKYQPQEGESIEDANIPMVRLSESYLNAAEAAVKINNTVKTEQYYKAIALRANPEAVIPSSITLDDVLEERRKELVGEGQRMFDLLRNNKKVIRIDITDDHMSDVEHFAETMEFDRNYYRSVLPVPQREINSNPNIEQTPEYLNN